MPSDGANVPQAIVSKLGHLIDGAQSVLSRLDRGEELSSVLSQAKSVVDEYGNRIHASWLEFEIYGLMGAPLMKMPLTDADQKAGAYLFSRLHSASDPTTVTAEGTLEHWDEGKKTAPERDQVMYSSVAEIERGLASWNEAKGKLQEESVTRRALDQFLQVKVLNEERARVLSNVRAYLYDYIAKILQVGDNGAGESGTSRSRLPHCGRELGCSGVRRRRSFGRCARATKESQSSPMVRCGTCLSKCCAGSRPDNVESEGRNVRFSASWKVHRHKGRQGEELPPGVH